MVTDAYFVVFVFGLSAKRSEIVSVSACSVITGAVGSPESMHPGFSAHRRLRQNSTGLDMAETDPFQISAKAQRAQICHASDSSAGASRVRWRFPLIVVVLAATGHVVGWWRAEDDISLRVIYGMLNWMTAVLVTLVWWTFFSGACWRTRCAGLGVPIAAIALFLVLFRMEGQSGDFIPHFSFRFAPSAEDRAAEYFDSLDPGLESAVASAAADSVRIELTAADWPRFGGLNQDHIVHNVRLRRDWDINPPRELWRHPVGPGWSSFAIVGQFAFTQEQRGNKEAVVCYEADTGRQIWLHTDKARFSDAASGPGPRATPTFHDSRLYTLGATGILNCIDPFTGAVLWNTNIVEDADTRLIEWGMAGSPLVYEDLVIVNPGGESGAVAAYDRITGEKCWAGGNHKASYASPQVAVFDGLPQVVIYCSEGVSGHDITSGDELWSFEWTNMSGLNIAQPVILPDSSVFISSGYATGSALLNVSGQGRQWQAKSCWERPNRFKLKFNGGIYRDGYIYGLDEGILSCFDLSDGKRTWKRGRYRYGQVVLVGDVLMVVTESGEAVLVEVSPQKAVEVARFQAIEGKTWNHPVVSRGRLFIRNGQEAACYDLD